MTWQVGVDVGGTFTDLIARRPGTLPVAVKVSSSPRNQAEALIGAVSRAIPANEREAIRELVHGTTVGTNAVLERKGAITALLTTKGFRDIVEMGRRTRPQVYGLRGTFEPHVPRWRRYEVSERLNHDGEEIDPVSDEEIDRLARAMKVGGVESVAIVLLHSYLNRAHEEQVRSRLRQHLDGIPISISAEVLPEIREFERTVATTINAYLQPVLSRYLGSVRDGLDQASPGAIIRVMQGNGGTLPLDEIQSFPVRTLLSGPAAGVWGAARVAADLGITNCITCDTGGTSFDVGVIEDGRPVTTTETQLEYNVPIRIPTLDIRTIGAGGGSIARLDRGGLLRVGPASAGAHPGPIWYGRGGTAFTVTDGNVLAGRLQAVRLGVDLEPTLSPDGVWKVASRENPELVRAFPSPRQLADATIRIVNSNMAGCVRDITVRRGRDPREYALLVFGGAGPLHAVEIARELGMRRVVIPNAPGLLSAYGCLVADFSLDAICTVRTWLDDLDAVALGAQVDGQCDRVRRELAGYGPTSVGVRVLYECHFERQAHSLYVEGRAGDQADTIRSRFTDAHRTLCGELVPQGRVMVRSVRVEGRGQRPDLEGLTLDNIWGHTHVGEAPRGWWRPVFAVGKTVSGPATIAAPDASIYIPEDTVATVAAHGHILVEV